MNRVFRGRSTPYPYKADDIRNNSALPGGSVKDALNNLLAGAGSIITSIFGRTGAVVSQASDYDADQVDYDNTTSGLSAVEVQSALDEIAVGLGNIVLFDTEANILASPITGKVAFATDTNHLYVDDGFFWHKTELKLNLDDPLPDMGAIPYSPRQGYGEDYVTDKTLHTVRILEFYDPPDEGAIRTTINGNFQIYLNGVWNDVVINFRFREDATSGYSFEHKPIGFNLWIDIMSGNSMDDLDPSGRPVIQQYETSMGAYQPPLIIDGGTF